MHCPFCGRKNQDTSKFCIRCGKQMVMPSAEGLSIQKHDESQNDNQCQQHPQSGHRQGFQPREYPQAGLYSTQQRPYAPVIRRFGAWLIDGIVIFGLLLLLSKVCSFANPLFVYGIKKSSFGGYGMLDLRSFFIALFMKTLVALYYALMETSPLQASGGKLLMGIQVVDAHGERISIGRSLGRSFMKVFICEYICLIGYIVAFFTSKKQALHDLVASTYVVNM